MQRPIHAKRTGSLLFLAILAFYLYGLNTLPFLGSDEPRYAEVAREMLSRADPITPTLGGRTWFEKPALLYWMIMAGFRLFGVSEWAARLGPALSGFGAILIAWYLFHFFRRKQDNNETASHSLWLAPVLASCSGLIVLARAATFDIVLTFTVTTSLACFLMAEVEREGRRQRLLFIGFYVFIGLSLLAKGLLGIVLPLSVIGFYYLFQRTWPEKRIIRSAFWGIPLALCVASSWYGPVIARHGWKFIDLFFIQQHFARYLSNKYHHPEPVYYYLPVTAMLLFPWTAFVVAGLLDVRRWNWRPSNSWDKLRIFSFAWLVAPIIFFSLSNSKLPAYVLPAIPGAILIGGEAIVKFLDSRRNRVAMIVTGVLLLIIAVVAVTYNLKVRATSNGCVIVCVAPLVGAAIIALFWNRRPQLCIVSTSLAMLLVVGIGLRCAGYYIAQHESVRDLLRVASDKGYGSLPLFELYNNERSSEFYASGRLAYRADGEPLKLERIEQVDNVVRTRNGSVLILVPLKDLWQLKADQNLNTEVVGDNGLYALSVEALRHE